MKRFKDFLNELNIRVDSGPVPAGHRADLPAIPAEKLARRRRYSHKFTADKILYIDLDKKEGRPYWRKKSTGSIVFYGKQQKKRKDDKKPYK